MGPTAIPSWKRASAECHGSLVDHACAAAVGAAAAFLVVVLAGLSVKCILTSGWGACFPDVIVIVIVIVIVSGTSGTWT